ncbi:uncharacterized protein LOC118184691 [Stegodyphus dumicola]|uniref:uncharacterized protein LOC118184691 n=1 Tax=Stegodyphus dumicola TaxID=202533 RepID=UPI0015AEC010|nr:uncharacterized protein LOC118184691 [Stegodyphus dumicola]XP_035210297.1 uncharacterized protein LOC118184691 [Stegodyphus dumicola]
MNEDIYSAQYLYNALIEYVYFVILHAQNKNGISLRNLEKHVKFFKSEVSSFIETFPGNDFVEKLGNMLCVTTSIFSSSENVLQISDNYQSLKTIISEDLIISKIVDLVLRGICNINDICMNLNLNSAISIEEELLFTILKKFPFFDILPNSTVMLVKFDGLLGFDNSTYSTVVNYFQSLLQNIYTFTFDEVRLHSAFLPGCGVRNLLMVFCILNHCKLFRIKSGFVHIKEKFKKKHTVNLQSDEHLHLLSRRLKKLVPLGLIIHEIYGYFLQNWIGEIVHLKQSAGFIYSIIPYHQYTFTIYFNKAALKYICEIDNLEDCVGCRDVVEFDAKFYGKGDDVNIYWIATRVKIIKQAMKCTFAELNSDSVMITENMYAELYKSQPAIEKYYLRKPVHDDKLEANLLSFIKELLNDQYMLPSVISTKTDEASEIYINSSKTEGKENIKIKSCHSEQIYNLSCDDTSLKSGINLFCNAEPINEHFAMDKLVVDNRTEKLSAFQKHNAKTENKQVRSFDLGQTSHLSCVDVYDHKVETNSFCNGDSLNEHCPPITSGAENIISNSSESGLNMKVKNRETAQIETLDEKQVFHLSYDAETSSKIKTSFHTNDNEKLNSDLSSVEVKVSSNIHHEYSLGCDISPQLSEILEKMNCDKAESLVLRDSYEKEANMHKYKQKFILNLTIQNHTFMFGSVLLITTGSGIATAEYKSMKFKVFFRSEATYPSNSLKSLEKGQKLLMFVPYFEYDNSLHIATLVYPLSPAEITLSEKCASVDDFTVNYFIPSINKNVNDVYSYELVHVSPISYMLNHKVLYDCFSLYISSNSSSFFNDEIYEHFQVLSTRLHKKKIGVYNVELTACIFLRVFHAVLEVKLKKVSKSNKCQNYNKLKYHRECNKQRQLKTELPLLKGSVTNNKVVKSSPIFQAKDILEDNTSTLSSYKSCDSIKSSDTFYSCESLEDDCEGSVLERYSTQKSELDPDIFKKTLLAESEHIVTLNTDLWKGESFLNTVNANEIRHFYRVARISKFTKRKRVKCNSKEMYLNLKYVPRFKPCAKKHFFLTQANFKNKPVVKIPAQISVITNSCLYLCTNNENYKTVLTFPRKIIPENMLKYLQVNTVVNLIIIPNVIINLSEIISMEICN